MARPLGTAAELERRRQRAVALLRQGYGVREVARIFDVSPGAVSGWWKAARRRGDRAIKAKARQPHRPLLPPILRRRLPPLLRQNPRSFGFATELWTLARIQDVIRRVLKVTCSTSTVARALRALGWSRQKPVRRAKQRDEQAIRLWRAHSWRALRRRAKKEGRHLVFIDECGFSLYPVLRRTWAPRGQTPVVPVWHRKEKQSVLGALSVSPRGKIRVWWEVQRTAFKTVDFVAFLRYLHRQIGRPLLVIWDRLPAHFGAAKRLAHLDIRFEPLPAYAPDLNPVEWMWAQLKSHTYVNTAPSDTDEIAEWVHDALASYNQDKRLLKGFFAGPGLKLGP